MIRTLLTTTALVAILSTVASAQTAQEPAAGDAAIAAPGSVGYFKAARDQVLATSVLGKTVYTGADEEGEAVGDINDVVINAEGGAEALVVGVGGFLGIGEKDVAVNFDRVSWSERDGERIIVISATKEELQSAPQFDRAAIMDGVAATVPAEGVMSETATAPSDLPAIAAQAQDDTAETTIPAGGTTPEMTDPAAQAPVEAEPDMTAAVAPSSDLQPVDPALLSAEKLIGTQVRVADDTTIGEISDVILSGDGRVEAYVIDVGGFLGIGEKPVAMSAQAVQVMADATGEMMIYSPFTRAQLERQPAYDEAAYKANAGNFLLMAPN